MMAYDKERYENDTEYRNRLKESIRKYRQSEKGKLSEKRAREKCKQMHPHYIRDYMRKRRSLADEKNVCIRCLKNPRDENYKTCAICRKKSEDKTKRYYSRHPKAKTKFFKMKREEARKKGLCTTCFERPAEPGKKRCKICIDRSNLQFKKNAL